MCTTKTYHNALGFPVDLVLASNFFVENFNLGVLIYIYIYMFMFMFNSKCNSDDIILFAYWIAIGVVFLASIRPFLASFTLWLKFSTLLFCCLASTSIFFRICKSIMYWDVEQCFFSQYNCFKSHIPMKENKYECCRLTNDELYLIYISEVWPNSVMKQ